MKKGLILTGVILLFTFTTFARIRVTEATGGSNISADTAANAPSPQWTTLTPITVAEANHGHRGDFSPGTNVTLILNAPSGFEFNEAVPPSLQFSANKDISAASLAISKTNLTITMTIASQLEVDSLVIGSTTNLQVRPVRTHPLASGNIYRPTGRAGGTAVIVGLISTSTPNRIGRSGATGFGKLVETPGAVAKRLGIVVQPSANAVVSKPFGRQPVVGILDAYDNLRPDQDGTIVTAAISSGAGKLLGTTNMASVGGRIAFTDLAANTASVITITFSNTSLGTVTSAPINVDSIQQPPIPTAVIIQKQPSSNAVAGVAFPQQPVIAITDQYDFVDTSDSTDSVTAAVDMGVGELQGTVTMQVSAGIATFLDLSYNVAEDITIGFTSGSLVPAVSDTVSIWSAAADRLAFEVQPGGAVHDQLFESQPVVVTQDQFGNNSVEGLPMSLEITVALTSGTGVLAGTMVSDVGADFGAGAAVFTDLSINTTGPKQLTASAPGLLSAISDTFNVAGDSQTITFDSLSDLTYGAAPFELTATASSGLPVTFTVVSGPATISGSTLTINGTGEVIVRASQAGDTFYAPAPDVDQSFTIEKAEQTISFSPIVDKVFGDAPFEFGATASSGLRVAFSILSGPATLSGDTITITGTGAVTIRASQPGDENYLAAADVDQTFNVNSANQTISFSATADKTYGDAPFSIEASASSGLPVTLSIVSGPASISGNVVILTGAGTVTIGATQQGDDTYFSTTAQQTFVVMPASLTISVNNATRWYSIPNPAFTGSITGLCSNDIIACAYTCSANTVSPIGSYPITVTVDDPNNRLINYAVTTNLGTLTVEAIPKPVITLNPQNAAVRQGGSVTLTGGASGMGVGYQWRHNGVPIPGATKSSLRFAHVHKFDRGVYRLWATNSSGPALTSVALLDVVPTPCDFDENGSADIPFQRTDGRLACWMMQTNHFWFSAELAGTNRIPAGWRVVGQGDFTGEGHVDLLLQDTSRRLMVWALERRAYLWQTKLLKGGGLAAGWNVVGAGDMNRNYQTDILLQNDDGRLMVLLMYRTIVSRPMLLQNGTPAEPGWKAVGLRDFNSDGKPDILFQQGDGRLAVWLMNDLTVQSKVELRSGHSTSSGWRIAGLADLNGNKKTDILWQKTDGSILAWWMNDTQYQWNVRLRDGTQLTPGWTMIGPK